MADVADDADEEVRLRGGNGESEAVFRQSWKRKPT